MASENTFEFFYHCVVIIFGVIWFLLMLFITKWLMPFIYECSYIRMEMSRNEGTEHDYWRRKLIRHYLRLIPFVGLFLKDEYEDE